MTKETAASPTLAAVIEKREAVQAARIVLNEAIIARDLAIGEAVDAGDSTIDITYAARMSAQNITKRLAARATVGGSK